MEAFNSGDVDRMEELTTDRPEIAGIRAALEETSYVGPDAVRRFWADATEIWSELSVDVMQIDMRDDTVTVRGMWHGRGRESGIDVDRELGFRFRVEAGLVAGFRTFIRPRAGWLV
jgi:hypothetical protein